MNVSLKQAAELLFLYGNFPKGFFDHWEYRKGKTASDVSKARSKVGKKYGGKLESELNMMEVYLKDIFKKKRGVKN